MKRLALLLGALLVCGPLFLASCGKEEPPKTAAAPKLQQPPKPVSPPPAKIDDPAAQIRGSIEKAVAFLGKAQREDGGWGEKQSDVGITGLVIEALAKAPGDIREKNKAIIDKGVAYILANKREDGSIVNKDGQVANYRTSIGVRALIAVDKDKHRDVIDAAVKYTKGIQGTDPDNKAKFGAIGYGSDETKGDIINEGEALEMLKQAGVGKDDEVWKRAQVFLGRTQNLDEQAEPGIKTSNDGGGIYRSTRDAKDASKAGILKLPDGTEVPRSYGGATYNLIKSLLFAGLPKDNPRVVAAYRWICEHYTVAEHPELGKQGLFYFYYTMARTLEVWGTPTITKAGVEHNWAKELGLQIISLQKADGSWVNPEDRWWESDPALVTAYAISSLNICHRMIGK